MSIYVSAAAAGVDQLEYCARPPTPPRLPHFEVVVAPPGQRLTNDAAARVAAEHRRDAAGICVGCVHWWGHLVRHPCTALVWARLVLTNG